MIYIGGVHVNPKMNGLKTRRIEEAISHISAKVANVIEASQQAKMLSFRSETLFISVRQELEDLYISMENEPK